MARSGRFGRLPRSAPDLTSTIVALMREYNALVDRNVVDAWKNGGDVDGKAVTDTVLLEHFRARRDSLSKADPLWTEWDNRVTQYDFAIQDSKMQVRYDNGKATDMDMAHFYQQWADKTPNNTEFDRTLLSAVGKFRAASAARASAGAAQAGRDSFVSTAEGYRKTAQPSLDVIQALVAYANQTGIAPGAESLLQVEVVTGGVDRLLDLIQDGVDGVGGQVGNEIALKTLNDALAKAIPGFEWGTGRALISQTLEKGAAAATKGAEFTKDNKYSTKEWQTLFDNTLGVIEQSATRINGLDAAAQLRANANQLQRDLVAARDIPFAEDAAYRKYFAANDVVAETLRKGQVGDQPDFLVTGIINEKTNYVNAMAGNQVVPLQTWNMNEAGATARFAEITAMGKGMEMLRKGGWLQIVPDTHDPTKMTYEIRPGTEAKGTLSLLVPGSNIVDPTTGAVIPIYVLPSAVQFATVGSGTSEVRAPAYRLVDGQPVPKTNAKGEIIPGEFEELGNAAGIRVFRLIDGDGNPYNVYQQEMPDGGWGPMLLHPPIVPGANVRETQVDGKVVLELTVDPVAPFMLDAGVQALATARMAKLTGAQARASQQAPADSSGQVFDPLFPSIVTGSGTTAQLQAQDAQAKLGQIGPAGPAGGPSGFSTAVLNLTRDEAIKAQRAALEAGLTPPGIDVMQFIDTSTFQTTRPDVYSTVLAISLANEFSKLDLTDPVSRQKLPGLIGRVNSGEQTLLGMAQYFTKTGDAQGLAQVQRDLQAWQRDRANLDGVVAAARAGVPPGVSMLSSYDPYNKAALMNYTGGPTSFAAAAARSAGSTPTSRLLMASRLDALETGGAFGGLDLGASAFNSETGVPGPAKAGAPLGGNMAKIGDPRAFKLPTLPDSPMTQGLLNFANQNGGAPTLGPSGGPSSFAAAAQRMPAPLVAPPATPIAAPKVPTPTPLAPTPAPAPAPTPAPAPYSPYLNSGKIIPL